MTQTARGAYLIPPWFKLESYSKLDSLPLVDWGLNLLLRRRAILGVSPCQREAGSETALVTFQLIKAHGVIPRESIVDFYQRQRGPIAKALARDGGAGHGLVSSLPLSRAFEIWEGVQQEYQLTNAIELSEGKTSSDQNLGATIDNGDGRLEDCDIFDQQTTDGVCPLWGLSTAEICVDLDAPDAMIEEAFSGWLKAKRSQIEAIAGAADRPATYFSRTLTQRWGKHAVLPYLDLLLYQLVDDVTIPLEVVGDAIFPSSRDIGVAEAVRKQSRPAAEMALRQAPYLLKQALIEEERSTSGKNC